MKSEGGRRDEDDFRLSNGVSKPSPIAASHDAAGLTDVHATRPQSVGNFILVALQSSFGGDLQAAIDWLARASGVPGTARVLPSCSSPAPKEAKGCREGEGGKEGMNGLDGPTIHAILENGQIVVGQNEISHPPVYPR